MKLFSSKSLFALLTFAVVGVTSCSKNDSTPGPNPTPSKRLARIEESDNSITTFSYNADGTFQKIQTSGGDGDNNTMTFAYANNKVASITNSDGSKISYVSEGGKIIRAEIYNGANTQVSHNDFSYQNGKITSVSVFVSNEEEDPEFINYMKTDFTYYGNGDTKEMTVSILNPMTGELELSQKRSFEQYDTKTNPLAQLGDFSSVFLMDMSARNVLLEKSFDAEGALQETVENQYTYDAAGYPVQVSVKTTPAGGTPETSTMKFFYN